MAEASQHARPFREEGAGRIADGTSLPLVGVDGDYGGDDAGTARQPFDTNADILPAKRVKGQGGAAATAEEAQPEKMSKRKKRKLEQLARKRESQELRSEVLKELRSVHQLTPEQAALLKASQSTNATRRKTLEEARQRVAMGVPLTSDMKRLRIRKGSSAVADEKEQEALEKVGDPVVASTGSAGARGSRGIAAKRTPAALETAARDSSGSGGDQEEAAQGGNAGALPRKRRRRGKKSGAKAAAGEVALGDGSSTAAPATAEERERARAAAIAASLEQQAQRRRAELLFDDEAPRPRGPALSPQPLIREIVSRREDIEEQRAKLPAVMMEQELVEMSLVNDVLLVCGETGCGKSTQVPQFLFEAGFTQGGGHLIGVTQPRRVAAISVSQRVESELNRFGTVGYQVRYDKSHCTSATRIKFMTDGILLREVQADFLCKKYSVIIIDEAHERGVNCDILIGLLSRAVQRRRRDFEAAVKAGRFKDGDKAEESSLPPPPLKLVIMSATLRLCDFTENQQLFPEPPPVMRIEARTFPVTAHFARSTEDDYIKAAKRSVLQIHKQLPPGTILVFVTGKQEVHRLCKLLNTSHAARPSGRRDGDDNGEDEQDGADEEQFHHQLEASDDEGGENFDDDLPDPSDPPSVTPKTVASSALGAKTPKEAPTTHKALKKKTKKKNTSTIAKRSATVGGVDEGGETEDIASKTQQALEDDECDVNYRIDAEEYVVVLDPEVEKASAAEDAKDAEAKRQKNVRMAKLDKSRTANGVFKGCGFGEGPLRTLPLYAQLPARAQLEPFSAPPEDVRIVVVSTNVAETSVTLPNVRYVVDCGHEKRKKYRASSGVSSFAIERISKASADQRAGRAGRLGPGHTYRLYSAAAYENHFSQFAPIPILHTPMDPVLLLIAFLGVPRLDVFPWPTPPSPESVVAAMHRLRALGAIAGETGSSVVSVTAAHLGSAVAAAVRCTKLGFRLAALPVAPRYGRILLDAVAASETMEDDIIGHACAIVAALSVGNLTSWESLAGAHEDEPKRNSSTEDELVRAQREAQRRLLEAQKKEGPRWSQLRDDAEGLLWLMGGYSWAVQSGEEAAEEFCRAHRLNARQIGEAYSLMQQLGELLRRRLDPKALGVIGKHLESPILLKPPTSAQALKLRECIVAGLIDHIAVSNPDLGSNAYVCADLGPERPVFVHTSSNVYRRRPRPSVLVFNEIISTTRPCMRDCIGVDPLALARRASAASGDCPLLQLGDFLPVPAPRYLRDQDRVMAFCSPTYGPLAYRLPTVEIDIPKENIFRYKVFAKAFLEGEVMAGCPPRGARLLALPSLVLHAPTNPRVQAVVQPLWAARVGSRKELLQKWSEESRFLLEGLLKWLPPSSHDDISIAWPPSGKSAGGAGSGRK